MSVTGTINRELPRTYGFLITSYGFFFHKASNKSIIKYHKKSLAELLLIGTYTCRTVKLLVPTIEIQLIINHLLVLVGRLDQRELLRGQRSRNQSLCNFIGTFART